MCGEFFVDFYVSGFQHHCIYKIKIQYSIYERNDLNYFKTYNLQIKLTYFKIMKLNAIIFISLFMSFSLLFGQKRPIGTNLTSVNFYSNELVFTDIFKQSGKWVTQNAEGSSPWNTNLQIPILPNGFPKKVPFTTNNNVPQKVAKLLLELEDAIFPKGTYRLIVTGKGKVRIRAGNNITLATPINTLIEVNNKMIFEILESNENNPISDVKLILPKYVDTYQTKVFTDEFIEFVDDFELLRFMDWTETNNSEVIHWSDRSKDTYHTQGQEHGTSWENTIRLCNFSKKNAWINIPHQANNNYVRQLAKLLNNTLQPDLKIYLEYSNEVWNSQFEQHKYAINKAKELGYSVQEHELAWLYTAKRSADIFRIFEQEFTNDDRLIKVLPSQSISYVANKIIEYFNTPSINPTKIQADYLAIAPYFGGSVANTIVDEGLVSDITVPQILERTKQSMEIAFDRMKQCSEVAQSHAIDLITYEGGQHLVGSRGNENIEELTNKLIAANHHPKMKELYQQYFNHWYENYGGLFVNFSSHGRYSKWGSWGIKEHMENFDNPKYKGLQKAVFSYNTLPEKEYFYIKNKYTQKHLKPIDDNLLSGLTVASNDFSDWFQWEKVASDNGYFYLKNKKTGYYFRPVANTENSMMEQQIITYNGNKTQWRIDEITDDEYVYLVNRWTNDYIRPNKIESDNILYLKPSEKYKGQWTRWSFENVAEENIDIQNESSQAPKSNKLKLYPNPASNFINVSQMNSKSPYFLIGLDGKVLQKGYFENTNDQQIDLGTLETGIYFFKQDKQTVKLLIQQK